MERKESRDLFASTRHRHAFTTGHAIDDSATLMKYFLNQGTVVEARSEPEQRRMAETEPWVTTGRLRLQRPTIVTMWGALSIPEMGPIDAAGTGALSGPQGCEPFAGQMVEC